jgi:3-deoxy-D-manno-octulosonic-acid transferase
MTKLYLTIYNILLVFLLAPAALFVFIWRRDFFYRIAERLGFYKFFNTARNSRRLIWVHCSSLGEVKAVETTINELQKTGEVLLTVFTRTARDWAQKNIKTTYLAFAPLDVYPLVLRVVKKLKPAMLIIVETEIWPSMIYACKKNGAKIVTVNGRLSNKSFKYYKATKHFWRAFVSNIDVILARNSEDGKRFTEITSRPQSVRVTGNIKYDLDFTAAQTSRADIGFSPDDIVIVFGSTREGEEQFIKNAYIEIIKKYPNIKFIVAPRHIKRLEAVLKVFSDINVYLYSQNCKAGIVIVDVFGKLQGLYSVADICFVGGSLVDKGGQNPIEPAAYAKPVIFGTYMYNFETESKTLANYGGGFFVKNENELISKLEELIKSPALREAAGKKALEGVNAQKGATEKNLKIIRDMLA